MSTSPAQTGLESRITSYQVTLPPEGEHRLSLLVLGFKGDKELAGGRREPPELESAVLL